jgi:hypothetical protein
MALYKWNADLSAAWWVVLAHFEVLLRNALHERLTQWSRERFGEERWYLDPGGVLSSGCLGVIASARSNLSAAGQAETPSRIITELSFGFWRFLLSARYERVLWLPATRRAFPGLLGKGMRKDAHDAVMKLHGLRNRIAHHEPIHNRQPQALHESALRTAAWICPETAKWISAVSKVPGLLARRP